MASLGSDGVKKRRSRDSSEIVEEPSQPVAVGLRGDADRRNRTIAEHHPRVVEVVADGQDSGWFAHGSGLGRSDQRIRHDELVFRVADDEHRTARQAHHPFRDATHEEVRHRAAAVRPHDDEVGAGVLREIHDRHRRGVRSDYYTACRQRIGVVVNRPLFQLGPRGVFDLLL